MDKDTRDFVIKIAALVVVTIVALVGYYAYARLTAAGDVVEGDATSASRIRVWEDDERGVTCYIYDGIQNDSMFCIANSELSND